MALNSLFVLIIEIVLDNSYIYVILTLSIEYQLFTHEWLSGGVSPCQGEGRGFESRLVLFPFAKKAF